MRVGPVLNHDESEAQVSPTVHPGVYVRSFYFNDPDGITLEFACWTKEFTDSDAETEPRTAADRRVPVARRLIRRRGSGSASCVEHRRQLIHEFVGSRSTSPASHALIVWPTPPTTKCAAALILSVCSRQHAVPRARPTASRTGRRVRHACVPAPDWPARALNSRRPTRDPRLMVRTMLAMPARFCSSGGAAATAACVVAAMSAITAVEHGGDEFVLVGEAFVEVARGQAGPAADARARSGRRAVDPPSRSRPASRNRRRRCASRSTAPDAAIRAELGPCDVHLDTFGGRGQYLKTDVLTIVDRNADDGQ